MPLLTHYVLGQPRRACRFLRTCLLVWLASGPVSAQRLGTPETPAEPPATSLGERLRQAATPLIAADTSQPSAGDLSTLAGEQKRAWSFSFSGELTNYFITQAHAYFGAERRSWLETSARLEGRFRYKALTFAASGLGLQTSGRDPYGTGTTPAGAPPGTGPVGTWPSFYLDQAYLQWEQTGARPFKLTVGRQHISLGSQFLIGDGVYDGFAPGARQAVFHNPRKGFDAVRLEWERRGTRFDAFVYRVDPTWDGGGKRDGVLGGLDVSRTFKPLKGSYGAGLFYRHSPSRADNNMAVLNLRGEQPLPLAADLYVSGELVWEFAGRCRSAAYCTRPGQPLNEYAGHVELGYRANALPTKPFGEAGYVYYSPDFTPLATGFSDWGKWYLGNQIEWIIFGTNTKVVRAQAGFWPHATLKLRVQYHHTRLATGARGALANEFSLITEWYPKEKLWFNLFVGDARPGRALGPAGLGNPFAAFNAGAAAVGTRRSLDLVLASGVRFW